MMMMGTVSLTGQLAGMGLTVDDVTGSLAELAGEVADLRRRTAELQLSAIGRQPLGSASQIRQAWQDLHSLGTRQFFDDPGLHESISRKIKAAAKRSGIRLEGQPGSAEDAYGSGPGSDSAGGPGADMAASGVPGYGDRFVRVGLAAGGESAFGTPRSYRPPVKIHDVGARDDGDPSDTGSERELARILKQHAGLGLFGGGSAAYGAGSSISPRTAAARRRAETRELAGGRSQSY